MKDRTAAHPAWERRAASLWALALLACALLLGVQLWRGAPLESRVTAMLPASAQAERFTAAEAHLDRAFASRLLILVSGPDAASAMPDLKRRLHDSGSIERIDDETPPRPDRLLAPYRYRLLTPMLADASESEWQERALSRLFTPGLDADPSRDPFGLLDAWLNARLAGPVSWQDGLPGVTAEGRRWQLLSARLAGSPYAPASQAPLVDAVDAFEQAHPQLTVRRAGLVFHAAAGTRLAKQEITTIGLGSLLGILLLLGWVFRRPGILASLLLPVAAGILFALPLTWAMFGALNLLTLAFGASLIGVAVDYALHLQCARTLHPHHPLARLWPGLALGLVSSLSAYLVQLATPLPGLRQMATFAALGLIGAWLTVRLWLPRLAPPRHPATTAIAARLDRCRLPARPGHWQTGLAVMLLAAMIAAFVGLRTGDDLRHLNPSPQTLVDQQRQVQTLLERGGGQRYLLATADSEPRLLARLESLDEPLSRLVSRDRLRHYRHLAQSVPSPQRQADNLQRVRQRYDQALPGVLNTAGLPLSLAETLDASLAEVPMLTPDAWLNATVGEADRSLWFTTAEGRPTALVLLDGVTPQAAQALGTLADGTSWLDYRDRVASLSDQLGLLRQQIGLWLALAMLGLVLLFGWRYRQRAWRVLLPPLGAVALTFGLFAVLGVGVTLFHLLGMLLVLGIGLDAGIFSTEHPQDAAAWLAISLSCASSLLAFGLLAFSATPALHYLGLTCLVGLVATWALVPFSRGATRSDRHDREFVTHGTE
ncbi:MMPL family transporter [Halomonas sp. THAF12]|uniref:MMPL family transporter n=1 Tax=Halomonas sp. B23F22_10 TaxID=3459515 RepID=UPI00373DFFB8